jgi:hypothetical protein
MDFMNSDGVLLLIELCGVLSQTKWQPAFAMRTSSISDELCAFKGRHFDRSVIVLCVRWYLAYNLSLRDLEEMMAERRANLDHSTVHRCVVHFSPQLAERFNRSKRADSGRWHMDDPKGSAEQQDLYKNARPMDVPISLRRRHRRHGGVVLQPTSGSGGCQTLPSQGACPTWSPGPRCCRWQADQSRGDLDVRY